MVVQIENSWWFRGQPSRDVTSSGLPVSLTKIAG